MSPRALIPAILAGCVTFACGPRLPPPERALPASSLLGWSAAPNEQSRAAEGSLQRLAAELAALRGLELARVPTLVELPRGELIATAVELVRRSMPEELRAAAVRALTTLELAPADFDYLVSVETALTPSLQAFYDPDRRSIFVDRALAPPRRERATLHELVHAAQFESRSAHDPRSSSDQRAALLSLAEGEAAYITEHLRPATHGASDDLESDTTSGAAPPILLRSLAAPYVDGHTIVLREYRARGWAAIDELWSRLPLATHQLLHPEAARPPVELGPLPGPEGHGWRLRSSDVLGEQALRCVLEEWWPEAEARRVAGAWIGDRLAWFETDGGSAVIWALRFDGSTRATEALEALESGLHIVDADVRHGKRERATPLACRAHRDSGVLGILSQAEHVWLLALHGLSTEAGCRGLAEWAERVASQKLPASTWVRPNSPVATDP